MNEEEIEKIVYRTLVNLYISKGDIKKDIMERLADTLNYVLDDCVCANYKQKHRSELFKKLTGENKTFIYKGS